MRILQVVHGFPPEQSGGADLYASRLATNLAQQAEVRVFTATAREGLAEGDRIDESLVDLPVTRIQRTYRGTHFSDPWHSATCEARFREVLAEFRPQVVHVHHLTNLSLGLPALARETGARVVQTLHDYWLACQRGQLVDRRLRPCSGPGLFRCASCWPGPGAPPRLRRVLGFWQRSRTLRRALAATDLLVAPAHRIADWFGDWSTAEIPAEARPRIVVEGYGMPPLAVDRPARLGPLRLGFLGTMMFTKGVHVVLEALLARPEAWNLTLTCHGGISSYHEIGGYDEYLESLRCRRPETIRFAGPYAPADLGAILAGLDAICCPSIWPENSPLVVHEALQAGVPVIGSDRGGIPELVREGRDGFLLPPDDLPAWTRLLARLDADPGSLRALTVSDAAVGDLEEHTGRILDLYRELL